MRVKFGNQTARWNHIAFCVNVSWGGGKLLNITTFNNGVYVVDCKSAETAKRLYDSMLEYGFIDVSEFEYSN